MTWVRVILVIAAVAVLVTCGVLWFLQWLSEPLTD